MKTTPLVDPIRKEPPRRAMKCRARTASGCEPDANGNEMEEENRTYVFSNLETLQADFWSEVGSLAKGATIRAVYSRL